MRTIGEYIPHCERPDCDMGFFYFECPVCNKNTGDSIDYYECLEGKKQEIECEHCKSKLQVEFSTEDSAFYVTENLDNSQK